MLEIKSDYSMHLTRGDTARIKIVIIDSSTNEQRLFGEGDELILSVKKNFNDEEYALQKTIVGANIPTLSPQFVLDPGDTAALCFGMYKYDVQLTTSDGDVYTVVPPSVFELLKEVTVPIVQEEPEEEPDEDIDHGDDPEAVVE